MRVDLIVEHRTPPAEDVISYLEKHFGPNDPAVLSGSPIGQLLSSSNQQFYSVTNHHFRLIAFAAQVDELQIIIEVLDDRIDFNAYDRVWAGVQRAILILRPRLTYAYLLDYRGERMMAGKAGLSVDLRQREVVAPLLIGLAGLLWGCFGLLTFASGDRLLFASGFVIPIVGGVIALGSLVLDSGRRRIRWSSRV